MKKPTLIWFVLVAALALTLTGCGGGGSSSSTPGDLDGDGVINALDAFPNDPAASVDSDGDGFPDAFNANATPEQLAATLLTLDAFPADPAIALDSDGDGFPDAFNVNATPEQKAACTKPLDRFPDDPDDHADADDDGVGDNKETRIRAAAVAVLGGSLAGVSVPEPENLYDFLMPGSVARTAAIQLGKALFWDMQVGSDGQACGSCHFHAGADNRTRNQLNPGSGAGDPAFGFTVGATPPGWGPDYTLTPDDFPLHLLENPELEDFNARVVLFDSNDVVSSQGVFKARFDGLVPGAAYDLGTPLVDDIFNLGGVNTRRVEPRNTPTMINAVFNFTNFWDGRAHPFFNGETVIGPLDASAGVWIEVDGTLTKKRVSIRKSSLASQAVGPPLSTDEMSFIGRTFPDIGRKLLHPDLQPLALQQVHPDDSVLSGLIDPSDGKGLAVSYASLIQAAFQPAYWGSTQPVTLPAGEFTQMEANFALFFGLALQMYQATLVSDQTPLDRFMEGDDAALGSNELKGLKLFINLGEPAQLPGGLFGDVFAGVSRGFCAGCHEGPEFTAHSVAVAGVSPIEIDFLPQLVDGLLVPTVPPVLAFLDEGMYNIGIRPTAEDLGRGGSVNGLPLSFTRQAIAGYGFPPNPKLPQADQVEFPGLSVINNRTATDGSFKIPGLRNVELTGPYLHNGGMATLGQVVEFYDRHGDFSHVNLAELDGPLSKVEVKEGDEAALVAFMLALTDERVKFEQAPFDHPQLFIPAGDGLQTGTGTTETVIEIPAVGAGGRAEPLKPFLNLDPFTEQPLP